MAETNAVLQTKRGISCGSRDDDAIFREPLERRTEMSSGRVEGTEWTLRAYDQSMGIQCPGDGC